MDQKPLGKLESHGRVGIRNKKTNKIIAVYPYRVTGTDHEVEEKVKSWFFPNADETEKNFANSYVDLLSYKELMNAKDSFVD